jgi:diguanylate cyclase (GGDEF)-like protein
MNAAQRTEPPPQAQAIGDMPMRFQQQSVLDLAHRLRAGLVIYPLVWLLLMLADGYLHRHPEFALTNGVGMVVCSLARHLFHQRLPMLLEHDFGRAKLMLRTLSLGHNLYWGLLCAYIQQAPDAPDLRWLMLISSVAIMAGGTVNVAIDSLLPRVLPASLLGPSVVVLLLGGGQENLVICFMVAMFLVYARSLSSLVQREYWGRQQTQMLLEQHARELIAISRTDALTGVANRLHFQEALAQSWDDAIKRQEPLAIAMVDLDHFKRVNDVHGHPFGDHCLQAAAQAIRKVVLKPTDLLARYGGEEFVVLLAQTDLAGARAVAQRMLDEVNATVVGHGAQRVTLSCSIGLAATVPSPRDGAAQLLQDADQALYLAKHQGRGRIECHGVFESSAALVKPPGAVLHPAPKHPHAPHVSNVSNVH